MAKKTYNEKITPKTDWGGDSSTGGLPVAGYRVQEFIKEQLNLRATRCRNSKRRWLARLVCSILTM